MRRPLKYNINHKESRVRWGRYDIVTIIAAVVFLVLFLCMAGCGTLDNLVELRDRVSGWFDEEGKPVEEQEPDEFTTAKFHTTKGDQVSKWKRVAMVKATVTGSRIFFEPLNPDDWKFEVDGDIVGELYILLFRDGAWHTGPADGIHKMPSFKEKSSACVPQQDHRLYVPKRGERVGIVVAGCSRNGKHMKPQQRSEICWVVWP